ncbi:hypothetical protein PMV48_17725 [Enterococcus avium]|uniref:hypothetical protein n=1 Tax=Enterococcus avium TaxID=33945 RepID=UPI00232D1680|nr:hypothetical protein [Enterococcus avium]MDB1725613.1 hypothetical protein [Enterococcus avium]
MKRKKYVVVTLIIVIAFIGLAGKNYADSILNWGGEQNISTINDNLDKLNDSLSDKEQKIIQLSNKSASTEGQLTQFQKDIDSYKQQLEALKNEKNNIFRLYCQGALTSIH